MYRHLHRIIHIGIPGRVAWVFALRTNAAAFIALIAACLRDRTPGSSAFESLAYDRINQLIPILRSMKGAGERIMDDALSSITLGLEIIRLRQILRGGRLKKDVSSRISGSLSELARMFSLRMEGGTSISSFVLATRSRATEISDISTSPSALQAAASMRLIAVVIEDHPSLVSGRHAGPPSVN